MIAREYLTTLDNMDKSSAAIAAIRDYDSKLVFVRNAPDEIKTQCAKLTNPKSGKLDGMPTGTNNPHSTEDMWAMGIDRLELIRERYREALLFVMWFEPVWLALTERERRLLESYKYVDTRIGLISGLAEELNCSVRNIPRLRKRALSRLIKLLYEPMSDNVR